VRIQKGTFAYTYIAELTSNVLELPFGSQNHLSMVILMPLSYINLLTAMEKLEKMGLARVFEQLNKADQHREMEIHIPKFKTKTDFALNTALINVS
jgi:serine protease inhibitor